MTAIAVTGASGSVGRRVVEALAADPAVGRIRAVDRIPLVSPAEVDFRLVDLTALPAPAGSADPDPDADPDPEGPLFAGCDILVHLADDPAGHDIDAAPSMLERVLFEAERSSCPHVVLLSSALVYGAYPANPVPLNESHRRRPNPDLAYAVAKARQEQQLEGWATATGASHTILRPTATLSEKGASWIAGALRRATSLRADDLEVPVQFLHHDDLAAAVCLVALERLSGVFNVAPDGWVRPEVFTALLAEAELRWPAPLGETYSRVTRAVQQFRAEAGITPYIEHPWVVANDRLRAAGWAPTLTNEETFVAATSYPWWRLVLERRRQEVALGVVGAVTAAVVAGAGLVARRLVNDR